MSAVEDFLNCPDLFSAETNPFTLQMELEWAVNYLEDVSQVKQPTEQIWKAHGTYKRPTFSFIIRLKIFVQKEIVLQKGNQKNTKWLNWQNMPWYLRRSKHLTVKKERLLAVTVCPTVSENTCI